MKKTISLLIFFSFAVITHADTVIYDIDTGVLTSDSTYRSTFYYDVGLNHNSSNYIMTDTAKIVVEDGSYYEIQSFLMKGIGYEEFGDSIFNKICISYYASLTDANPSITYTFHNDNLWTRFNYWGFGNYTGNRWRPSENILLRKIRLSQNYYAIVFRGYMDAVDPAELTIFILHNGSCELVYNQCRDILNITEDGNTTIFTLLRADYGVGYYQELETEVDLLIPRYQLMMFGNGNITLSSEVSDTTSLLLPPHE